MDNQPPPPPSEPQITQAVGTPLDPPPLGQKEPTKKDTAMGCGCLIAIVLVAGFLLRGCFAGGGLSESDLKDPPTAFEKLARQALASEPGIESIKVEPMGPDDSSYSVHVSYRAHVVGNEESTLTSIRLTMDKAYIAILKYPQLPVSYVKIGAQLELTDKHGNKKWSDVYRTQVPYKTLQLLNRENLDNVDFRKLWEEVYIHPIFWPYKD